MSTTKKYILLVMMVLLWVGLNAQQSHDKILRIDSDRMILTLDLKWDALQRYAISKSFDIDSMAIEKAYQGATVVVSGNILWKVEKLPDHKIALSKTLDSNPISHLNANDIFMIDDSWLDMGSSEPPIISSCGINKFRNGNVFEYHDGIAQFSLPNFKGAKQIYLSGSFNGWSTTQTPMQKDNSGWFVRIKLTPGKYTYKYIIDGKWKEDPNNYIRERDIKGSYNSVIYCTNYEFKLKGRTYAKRVVVVGSFNSWSENDYQMAKKPYGWSLPVYLSEGTHTYKFIVDGEWITDPENRDIRKDANGNLNSFIGLGDAHLFRLEGFLSAQKVILSGSFNSWDENELVMEKNTSGWQLSYILAPGTYEYKYIVDGKWMIDPANPLTVGSDNYTNSVLIFKPNFTFTLSGYDNAKNVVVTGTFNGWNRNGYSMYRYHDKWILPLYLYPGKYLYKYIVDGNWILDPDNKLWEENEYGTGNSVIWVDDQISSESNPTYPSE